MVLEQKLTGYEVSDLSPTSSAMSLELTFVPFPVASKLTSCVVLDPVIECVTFWMREVDCCPAMKHMQISFHK